VHRAKQLGFSAIALTDHDTMAGVAEALAAAESLGIELVPGVELSTLDGERQIDIIGYGVDHTDVAFGAELARIRAGRHGRAYGMVELLNQFGFPVSWERVQAIAGGENIGRPHVARAMVECGIVPDVKSAFTDEFIADGGRCYVQRVKITPEEAIERIHAAGGVAVAAHPGRTALTDADFHRLIAAGLDGIEVHYPRHSSAETAHFNEIAARHRLLVTGGSDDHGDINEGRLMGTIKLPYSHVERLREAIARRQRTLAAAQGA
jgi:predicted metal-dependent phosphoesterase TrpH